MAFTIPNEADAGPYIVDGSSIQAQPDSVDFDILTAGIRGDGTITGLAVTAGGGLNLDFAAGTFVIGATLVTIGGGTVAAPAADANFFRFDLVVVNSVGTVSVVSGIADATRPDFPAIPASSIVLAAVTRPPNDNTISADQIIPKDVVVFGPSDAIVSETAFGQAAAPGSGSPYSRGDHTHGTPTHGNAAHVAISHSALAGLVAPADDHSQYALLAGRAGGQTLIGGTAAGNILTLQSTSHAVKGRVLVTEDFDVDGHASFGAGQAPSPFNVVSIGENISASASLILLFSDLNYTLTGNIGFLAHWQTSSATGLQLAGFTATQFVGIQNRMVLVGPGTCSFFIGNLIDLQFFSTPTVTDAWGLRIRSTVKPPNAASGTIYGAQITDMGHANWDTVTALDILAQTLGGTATYNIRQRGTTGVNRFAAPTLIGADASPAAGVALELRDHLQLGANGEIRDSGGTARAVFSIATPHVLLGGGGEVRVNDFLSVNIAPSTGTRVRVGVAPDATTSFGMVLDAAGTLAANKAVVSLLSVAGELFLDDIVLDRYYGLQFNPSVVGDDPGFIGSTLTEWMGIRMIPRFQGATNFATFNMTRGDFIFLDPTYTAASGLAIGTMAGMRIANLGDATVTFSVAIDIEAQSGSATTLSVRALGTAPSIHQPAMLIGAAVAPAASAVLELQSTVGALLLPRMTTAQRNALAAVNGMMIYNTTTGVVESFEGGVWVNT